jgi:chromosome condensin MukBEF complex kleisin-like MukF subunit
VRSQRPGGGRQPQDVCAGRRRGSDEGVVRSGLPADQLIAAVRRTVRQADPTLVMEDARTINDIVLNNLQLERLSSLVMTFFGLAALLMATLGIYGVVSYFVRQRSVELGTRMALGAVNRDLVALVPAAASSWRWWVWRWIVSSARSRCSCSTRGR